MNRIELATRTDCQETTEPQTDSTSTKGEDEADGDQTSSLDEETCVETTVKEDATGKPCETSGRVTQLDFFLIGK